MRTYLAMLMAAAMAGGSALHAQQVVISPQPQQITWGGEAFASSRLADIHTTRGVVGDKAVARYRKQVPQHSEGYYLRVTPMEIVLAARDSSGLFYGEQTLRQIVAQPTVMQCEVTDWPSVECRGVIEGFYGNPWSHADRLRQFDFYGERKLNIYVYGPKDDPYHRARWRDPYPDEEAARLRELVSAAHRNRVQFVWAIHPGGDIQWDRQDSMAVVSKLERMYELGIRTFAVFFDDIWGEGAKGDKQAGLLNYVTDQFVHKHKDVQPLIMCPTQYNKAWSGGDYLSTLGAQMYPEVRIMWTGASVVDMIERDDMEWINGAIRRKAFIWLNYPVNDYCQSRLLMGKTYGNGLDIADMVSGFCSNPMEYAEASKVSLYSIADYTWNMPSYDAQESWQRAMRHLMPTAHEAFKCFCENNVDLGKTGHGLRREGESPLFAHVLETEGQNEMMALACVASQGIHADALLADSVNHPEMLREIGPWVEQMRLQSHRATQLMLMRESLTAGDSVAFVGHYRALRAIDQRQKALTSRDFEGSIVKAKPVVGGTVVTPWLLEQEAQMVKTYRQRYGYGQDVFPRQIVEDGQYLIIYKGRYLTDAEASPDRTGDRPVFQAERDTINPQRQQWNIELDATNGRYKVTNVQDGRYINERGTFWASKSLNPFDKTWHTYLITASGDGYTIQCAESAGHGFWAVEGDHIENKAEGTAFQIVPMK